MTSIMNRRKPLVAAATGVIMIGAVVMDPLPAGAVPLPGGTLNPLTIPKYVTPLVIPPVMKNTGTAHDYDIAVRQFKQQILPGGIWNTINGRTDAFPPTTVWSYGPDADPKPDSTALGGGVGIAPAPNSQFNYPAYTMENTVNTPTTVDWINDLVVDPWACAASAHPVTDHACNYLSHLLPIDRTLHWANPEQLPCLDPAKTKDCRPDPANGLILQFPYRGPVPIITHVHGAHITPESDGYPEAWYLPRANNIPAGYATQGTLVNQYGITTNPANRPGVGEFTYRNNQPSTTIWYHDHSLGMTRNNVYAGPAGFWLLREPGGGETGLVSGTLPGPAPVAGEDLATTNLPASLGGSREKYREMPIVIQDRSFNADGSLFYPANRAFFEGLGNGQQSGPLANLRAGLDISTIGLTHGKILPSDIAPIWNPEAFFNTMVVNGVTWPTLDVEPDLYRFRLLDGCNSRMINLSLRALDAAGMDIGEVPFYQIGAEQSLLPNVVKVETGFRTVLPGNGTVPAASPAPAPEHALLMGLAERADVLVDFSNLPAGTVRVRMINTAPDAPFGGFPDIPADPDTTGQVMEFNLVADTAAGEGFTAPQDLVLSLPESDPNAADYDPAANGQPIAGARDLALLEEESSLICVIIRPNGKILQDILGKPDPANPGACIDRKGRPRASVPFAPKAAVLGTNGSTGGVVTLWSDPLETNPALNSTETWEVWNWTVDGHPIHLHLVKFKVVNREAFDPLTGALSGSVNPPEATEAGWKDTVISYPGEVTRLNATFDIAGLYVWHCHIVEHEDNEMMVPYCVGNRATAPGCNVVP